MAALISTDSHATSSRTRLFTETRNLEARVKAAITDGRIEEDIPGLKLKKVYSKESTKQVMIARVSMLTPPCDRY